MDRTLFQIVLFFQARVQQLLQVNANQSHEIQNLQATVRSSREATENSEDDVNLTNKEEQAKTVEKSHFVELSENV